MGSIKVTFSAVDLYARNCCDDYVTMINTANEILSRVEKMHRDVQEDYEKISHQIVRAQMMRDEIATKTESYEYKMESAAADVERCQAEIDYLYNHPDIITSTDEDGNVTTEEVYDYEAIQLAQRRRDEAQQIYLCYREKYNQAHAVFQETENTLNSYEMMKEGIYLVGEAIQSDIYEIKKYIIAMSDEAEYNVRSLQSVLRNLSSYLSSRAIFMPVRTHYEDFAASKRQ